MKTLYSLSLIVLLCLLVKVASAQVPEGMNYQAVARDAGGNVLANTNICIQSSIYDGSTSTVVYQETFNVSTNQFGLFTLTIGYGTIVIGTFNSINWNSIEAWQRIEMKVNCAGSYVLMGSSQLFSVPYARHSQVSSTTSGLQGGTANYIAKFTGAQSVGVSQVFDNGSRVGINTANPAGKLHIQGSANTSQLVIDAYSTQTNANPYINLRHSNGTSLLWIHTDAFENAFFGLYAGAANTYTLNTSGYYNTFIGSEAAVNNTTGHNNTIVGALSLHSNTSGNYNTAVGSNSMFANAGGDFNAAFGNVALNANTSGNNNTAIGASAIERNTTGAANTGLGVGALAFNTVGSDNTAMGYQALYYNVAGNKSVAIGRRAMFFSNNTSTPFDNRNIAIGYSSLYGSGNPASNTGNENTAIGFMSLNGNSTGDGNVALGNVAMYSNTAGDYNVGIGDSAVFYNLSGDYNVAIGLRALRSNTNSSNTAVGSESLQNNTTGNSNAAVGRGALFNNTTGTSNTTVGLNSMYANTTGINNTAVGRSAYFDEDTLDNTGAFGHTAGGVVEADNRIEIGNTSVSWIGGQVGWSTYSDARIKDNVRANVPGLDFITRLRPVTYNLNIHRQEAMVHPVKRDDSEWNSKYDIEQIRMSGFIAQEVAQAAQASGYDFSGVEAPKNTNGLYSLRYSEFVMPLVKAVQELSEENQLLKSKLESTKQILQTLQADMQQLKNSAATFVQK